MSKKIQTDINLKKFRLDELKPAKYNPRTISDENLEGLKASLEKFGLVEPIVVNIRDGRNVIVGGHQRFKVLEDAGIDSVLCLTIDRSDDDERLLNLTLNNPEIQGEFIEELDQYIEDLQERLGDDTVLLDLRIDQLRSEIKADNKVGLIDDDQVPEPTEAITRDGDLWILGDHRLLCGDSTKTTDVERLMGSEKADMVFTDPPYGVNYLDVKRKHKKIKGDENPTRLLRLLNNYSCPMYVCCNWRSLPLFVEVINQNFKACIVWNKRCRIQNLDLFGKQHEFILYAGPFGGEKTIDVDVWQINRETRSDHPTSKPVELVGRAISNSSNPGDLVWDPFCGSGTTIIACEKLNRRCFAVELDEEYCDVIVKRWEDWTGKKAKKSN